MPEKKNRKKLVGWYRKVDGLSVDILGIEAWVIPCLILCKLMGVSPNPKWTVPKRR